MLACMETNPEKCRGSNAFDKPLSWIPQQIYNEIYLQRQSKHYFDRNESAKVET